MSSLYLSLPLGANEAARGAFLILFSFFLSIVGGSGKKVRLAAKEEEAYGETGSTTMAEKNEFTERVRKE